MPLQLLYADAAPPLSDRVLATIGFGVVAPSRPVSPAAPPLLRLGMPSLHGGPYEIWEGVAPVRRGRIGGVAFATDGRTAMAHAEAGDGPIRPAARLLYRTMFEALDRIGFREILRFWNYLPRITGREAGEERYRLFNQGRRDAFAAQALQLAPPPAASALGSPGGRPTLVALAAREPGLPIENPRQLSAWRYPPRYGAASPDFSRALLARDLLFVSGTASIVGHESLHPRDPRAQMTETVANLRALFAEAARLGHAPRMEELRLKTYLRCPDDLPVARNVLERAFPNNARAIYLRADICREELLMETEAMAPVATPR